MKKCDHCPKKAIVTYDSDPRWDRTDLDAPVLIRGKYIGGLCEDHDTEENRDVITERWKKSS